VKIIGEAKGYIIHETCNGKYILCKILKEYGTGLEAKEQCKNDLVALVYIININKSTVFYKNI
jgi:hypothetical protein